MPCYRCADLRDERLIPRYPSHSMCEDKGGRRKSLLQRRKKKFLQFYGALSVGKSIHFQYYRSINVNSYIRLPSHNYKQGNSEFSRSYKHPGTSAVSLCPKPTQQTPPSFYKQGCVSAESLNRPTSFPGYSCLSAYMHAPSPERPTSRSDQNEDSICPNSYPNSCPKRCLCP